MGSKRRTQKNKTKKGKKKTVLQKVSIKSNAIQRNDLEGKKTEEMEHSSTESLDIIQQMDARRNARLPVVISIMALLTGMGFVGYNIPQLVPRITSSYSPFLEILENIIQKFIYSSVLIEFSYLLYFVFQDLRRYIITDRCDGTSDEESDTTFGWLVKGFIVLMQIDVILLGISFMVLTGVTLFSSKSIPIAVTIAILLIPLILCVLCAYVLRDKEIKFKDVGLNIIYLLMVSLMLWVILPNSANNNRIFNAVFNENGRICLSYDDNRYENVTIKIIGNDEEIQVIHVIEVLEEDVLFAKEEQYEAYNNLDGEEIYRTLGEEDGYGWKYIFEMSRMGLKDGRYTMEIVSKQGKENVLISNMFLKKGQDYIFAKDEIHKEFK